MIDEIPEQPESTPLEGAAPEQEHVEQPEQDQPVVKEVKPETPQQKNFKALKEAKERVERERDELLRRVQEQEEARRVVPEEPALNPDDLVEARYVDKKVKKLEEQLRHYQQQTETLAIESRLKAQYPDFDAIVSKDNLDVLRSTYPEIAATLNHSPDLYSKAVSAYTLIKKFNITSEDPYTSDKELAHRNSAKPKPLASISPQQGDTPLTKANVFASGKLTQEMKSQLYKEMMEARNNYTSRDTPQ